MPEVVWKAFIDFEVSQQEHDNARALYRRLLSMTDHVKVWASLADFELQAKGLAEARQVYQRGTARLKALDMKDARVALLEAWRDAEAEHGGEPASVEKRMPKRVRKRRQAADGTLEEYFDYVFPDDAQGAGFKLLARAHQWKQKQEGEQ
ncbi:NineTeen Complex (NTC) component [Linderina pennispora]|nr:NineTeen Complex (NTC) component [Linderina pennispora]